MKIGIVGYGWIGKATKKIFPDAQIYDKYIEEYNKPLENCDIAFLAVPTPVVSVATTPVLLTKLVIDTITLV